MIGNDTDGADPQEFRVVKMTKHENYSSRSFGNYSSRSFENDIALVEFETRTNFTEGIQPVCLPGNIPKLMDDKFVRQGVYIAGWGATSFRGPTSNILLQGLIQVVGNKECKERFSKFNNGQSTQIKLNLKKNLFNFSGYWRHQDMCS